MSSVAAISFYLIQIAVCFTAMCWLYLRFQGDRVALFISTILTTVALIFLAIFNLLLYCFIALILVLCVRDISAQLEHPKFGGYILGTYFGFFISFPVGVYSYAN